MKKRYIFLIFMFSGFSLPARELFTRIRTVVIPAAGLGTRWLPYTKAFTKEEIPIGAQPAIQFPVEEGIRSGIHNFIMILNERKWHLQDYFGTERNSILKEIGKYHLIAPMEELFETVNFSYVDQPVQRGLGDAILMTQPYIHDDYFAIMLPDELIFGPDPALAQMIRIAEQEQASVIGVLQLPFDEISHYGVVGIKRWISEYAYEISHFVEKPQVGCAPSNLACIGRYVLSSKIFDSLQALSQELVSGELQLTDAIDHMMRTTGERVIAVNIQGIRHDVGTPIGWMKAVMYEGLTNPSFASEFTPYVQKLTKQLAF